MTDNRQPKQNGELKKGKPVEIPVPKRKGFLGPLARAAQRFKF